MTRKRLVLIIGGIVVGVTLICVLAIGAIIGAIFYTIGHSDAAKVAKTFLQQNEKLRTDIGEVRDFGFFVTGDISTHSAGGDATLNMKVIGERRTVNATVALIYKHGYEWRVTSASYRNEAGQTVELLDRYGAEMPGDAATKDATEDIDLPAAGRERTKSGSDTVAETSDGRFEPDVLQADRPVLVEFGAVWCEPCREMAPVLAELAGEYQGRARIIKVDVDDNPATPRRYGVVAIPTLILFKNGQEQERAVGGRPRDQIRRMLDRHTGAG
jgi:thioredoxin 1